jgi:hypothetical protein
MAFRTGESLASNMLAMLTGIIVVVLVREAVPTACMAGGTLRVDIYRTGRPGRRGLATVTAGAGAGAAVAAGRTTHGVKAG